MKTAFCLVSVLVGSAVRVGAQDAGTVEALRNELRELRQRTQQLEEKLQRLETPTNVVSAGDGKSLSPAGPMTLVKGPNSYLNLSLDGLFAVGGSTANDIPELQPGGHDPKQRGFNVQAVETVFDGAIDPYFRGQANILFLMDENSETAVELEEAWLESTSLPWGLAVRAGQILTDFGRHNPTHPHAWSFVDSPLVAARLLGPDGLRNPGARVSWLAPTPFYSELSFSVQNSAGETASSFRNDHEGEVYAGRTHTTQSVRGPGDLLLAGRYSVSVDLTASQTLLGGISAAVGPNATSQQSDTQIYGVDLFWKWKPTKHSYGFPFVSWQTEAMVRHYQAGEFMDADFDGDGVLDVDLFGDGVADVVPRELLKDWGAYTQVAYGFRKGWVGALRFDYVDRLEVAEYERLYGDDPERARRWRVSPSLTWYPSEFSRIRLQYNMDERAGIGTDHSVWLQFEFLLGSHGAHKF